MILRPRLRAGRKTSDLLLAPPPEAIERGRPWDVAAHPSPLSSAHHLRSTRQPVLLFIEYTSLSS